MTQLQPKTALTIRPAKERFHSQRDWLDSYHSFSFSNHYDPAWTGFGPLLVTLFPYTTLFRSRKSVV